MIIKTCDKCEKEFKVGQEDLTTSPYLFGGSDLEGSYICETCYAENWDKGFSSSVDYSDQMMIRERNELFEEMITMTEEIRKAIIFLDSYYGSEDWKCNSCEIVRISKSEEIRGEDLVASLSLPCQNCQKIGNFHYIV